MKKRVYVETTVVSYFTARPSRDIIIAAHQETTRDLWADLTAKYEIYISAIVYQEAGKGDPDQAKMRLAAMETFSMLSTLTKMPDFSLKGLLLAGVFLPIIRKMPFILPWLL
jgi:hypothetical protein